MSNWRKCVCASCGAIGETRQQDPVWCPDCLGKNLRPGQRIVTCECGAIGVEDANDPAPGLCPNCLQDALDASLNDLQVREFPA